MKILVTGGTGFTGQALVRRHLGRGDEVVAFDNQPGLFHGELQEEGAHVVLGDIRDQAAVREASQGCSLVYHLAAAFRNINLPKSVYRDINAGGTRVAYEAARDAGAERLIYCSTCGVHGHCDPAPANEDAPIRPEDYYQQTKYEGEVELAKCATEDLPWCIIRPAAIYGPGDPERFLILFRRARGGSFLMFGPGKAHYHPLYIDNLVDLFLLAAEKEEAIGRTYLGADEEHLAIQDLVVRVGRAMGLEVRIRYLPFWPLYAAACVVEGVCRPIKISPPLFRRRVDWFRQNRAFDISRAKRELGYAPRVGLDEGLRRTWEWYRERGYL